MSKHHQGLPPQSTRSQAYLFILERVWHFMLLCLGVSFVIGSCLSQDQIPRLTSVVGRGTTFIALDLPPTGDGVIERIRIWKTPQGVSASRGPQDAARASRVGEHFVYVDLTEREQEALIGIQHDWCEQLPTFQHLGGASPFYEIAITCPGLWRERFVQISPKALPLAFKMIIDATFEPTRISTH